VATTPTPTAEEIGERVRAALNAADLSVVQDLLDADVQWGPPGDQDSGCHNRVEVLEWFQRALQSGVRAQVSELVVKDGKLLIGLRIRGRAAGPDQDERWQVMTLRAGRIVDIRGFEERTAAAAFAGMPQ
jgi:ketosteroid isomerase-like protein